MTIQQTKIVSSSGTPQDVDTISNGSVVILTDHHEVHEGETYGRCYAQVLGAGEFRSIIIEVASGYQPHLVWDARAGAGAEFGFYGPCSYTAPGSEAGAPLNHNFNYANSSTVTLIESFTIQNTGTMQCVALMGAGQTAGGGNRSTERILAPGNAYMAVLLSNAATNRTSLDLWWYEEEA